MGTSAGGYSGDRALTLLEALIRGIESFAAGVKQNLDSYLDYALLVILFSGFVYVGLRPLGKTQFQADDLFQSRIALALAPLPFGILLFALGISRPYLTMHQFGSRVPRVLAFVVDWVFIGIVVMCGLMYLVNPFTMFAAHRSKALPTIYYVTDREPLTNNRNLEFSGEPSDPFIMSYGLARIPITWRPGDVNYNSSTFFEWDRYFPVPEQLRQFRDSEQFTSDISATGRDTPRREAFLFVHGFDNKFKDALVTTAKLAYDLKFDSDRSLGGVSILYSWPSRGSVTSYDHDYKNATWSITHLTDLLRTLTTRHDGLDRVQLIAHSMGTRVLGQAVEGMEQTSLHVFDNVALAAADVDEKTFDEFSPALRNASGRVTLYVSQWDVALALSTARHLGYRVGLVPVRRDGMDVIDTDGLQASDKNLKHSYLFESQFVLVDLFYLIRHDDGPDSRVSLVQSANRCCWQFEKR
jgi:esterase/lipase superfamily enzyme